MKALINWFRKPKPSEELGQLLAYTANKEDLLGIKALVMPTPDTILNDAAHIGNYSKTTDYAVFVKEAWARVLTDLDIILDDRTTDDKVKYYRGSLKRTLDLLRLSYQARSTKEALEKDMEPLPSSK